MKQNIIKKQWEEIDKKLVSRDWRINASKLSEYPNIGQLIEFLGDDLTDMDYHNGEKWIVICTHIDYQGIKKELLDVLWEAVKYKLNALKR